MQIKLTNIQTKEINRQSMKERPKITPETRIRLRG